MKVLSVIVVSMGVVGLAAQEGAATLPKNYQVQLENEWVKVTSVRYEPMQKLAPHTHTPNPSAYVYLNDGPPVIFRHIGGKGTAATRPATKAGAFRVYRGLVEVHEVENTGGAPSEFLRVEFKTAAKEPGSFWGKFERPATPSPTPTVHFDHPQLRVSRLWAMPGGEVAIAASPAPSLLIALAGGAELQAGQARWIEPAATATLRNHSTDAIDFLRFDFRTSPVPSR